MSVVAVHDIFRLSVLTMNAVSHKGGDRIVHLGSTMNGLDFDSQVTVASQNIIGLNSRIQTLIMILHKFLIGWNYAVMTFNI